MLITSRQNPTIKRIIELREAKGRREQGRCLLDSTREIDRALATGRQVMAIYYCRQHNVNATWVSSMAQKGIEVVELGAAAFEAIAYRENPEAVVAEMATWSIALADLKLNKPSLVVIAEDIEKPGNLGTLLRTADATGVAAVIGCNTTIDLWNPNTLRASAGAVFGVPYAAAPLAEVLAWVKQQGLDLIATAPNATKNLWQVDLREPCAIAVGSEAWGLSEELQAAATERVSLPMRGVGDSLNVSVATGVVLYEALRQRSLAPEI